MNCVGKFEKVSYETFKKSLTKIDGYENFTEEQYQELYSDITIPRRATRGSAAYDFAIPCDVTFDIDKGQYQVLVPTGIKCRINKEGWFLGLYPRSSAGIKMGITLANTVGIIDADYYNNSDNEGHIMIALKVDSRIPMSKYVISKTTRVAQGIFQPFGFDENEEINPVVDVREGGIGSTSK